MISTTMEQNATIHVLQSPGDVGKAAAQEIAQELRLRLISQASVRMIFAAAPSQSKMLHALAGEESIDWSRIEAFHMDEYIGLPEGAPQLFSEWLRREFFHSVPLGRVHLLKPGKDAALAAADYTKLLNVAPIDIVCLGIGMNGHLAFNDPPADFHEADDVRVVALDQRSRQQQVEEGLFRSLGEVPTHALTLSIPRLLRADKLYCCVSGTLKTDAVTRAFTGTVDPSSPASILREHPGSVVYLDTEAAAGLQLQEN